MARARARTAVIIGSTRGIGLLLAHQLAARDWNLAISGREPTRPNAVSEPIRSKYGVQVVARGFDVGDAESFRQFASAVVSELPPIELIIYSAGILGPIGTVSPFQAEEFERCLKTNVVGFFNAVSTFLSSDIPNERHVSIVALSGGGLGGDSILTDAPAYVPSKAAVVTLAEVLAPFSKLHGASVNVVAPGNIPTDFLKAALVAGPEIAGERLHTEAVNHQNGDALEAIRPVVEMIEFLVSPENHDINGRFLSARWDNLAELRDRRNTLAPGEFRLRRIDGHRYDNS